MHYTKAELLAARFWFNENSIKTKTIADHWGIKVADADAILESEEYLSAIEGLIRTTRSQRNLLNWLQSYDATPSALVKRFRLSSEEGIRRILEKVKQDIRARQ